MPVVYLSVAESKILCGGHKSIYAGMAVPKVGQGTCYVNITKVHLCFYVVSLRCFE